MHARQEEHSHLLAMERVNALQERKCIFKQTRKNSNMTLYWSMSTRPWVSVEDWSQDLLQKPKSMDAPAGALHLLFHIHESNQPQMV